MGRDYDEIVSVVRKQTFAVRAAFTRAESKDGYSPLNIYDGKFSRFPIVIINENKKAATGNIDVKDAPYIFKRSSFASNKAMEQELSPADTADTEEKSIAYTVKLTSNKLRSLSGKTPAQAYLEGFKDDLNAHYKWLSQNVEKYPKNREQMDAIIEAGRLAKEGKLDAQMAGKAEAAEFVIYDTGMRPNTYKTDPKYPGMNFVYEIRIAWKFDNNYPVSVRIENYYAPVIKKENGMLNVEKSKRASDSVIVNEMKLGADELEHIIYRMQMSMRNFEMLNAKACYTDCVEQEKAARLGNLNRVAV